MKKGEYKTLPKVTFIFAGKAAAGYKTAKSIIKFINCVSSVINKDPDINGRIRISAARNRQHMCFTYPFTSKSLYTLDAAAAVLVAPDENNSAPIQHSHPLCINRGRNTLSAYPPAQCTIQPDRTPLRTAPHNRRSTRPASQEQPIQPTARETDIRAPSRAPWKDESDLHSAQKPNR